MKLSPYRSTSLAAGAFLLAGSFALAQSSAAARNMRPRDAASGQSSGRQAQSGGGSGTAAQGLAVDHAGGNGVRRMDGDKSGDNPLYEGRGQANLKHGPGSSAETRANAPKKKHLAGVKYQDRTSGGDNNPRGLAVNEQGSTKQGNSSAPVRRRR